MLLSSYKYDGWNLGNDPSLDLLFIYLAFVFITSFPDPTLQDGKGLETVKHFLGLMNHHMIH
jgi:hypothetical protein